MLLIYLSIGSICETRWHNRNRNLRRRSKSSNRLQSCKTDSIQSNQNLTNIQKHGKSGREKNENQRMNRNRYHKWKLLFYIFIFCSQKEYTSAMCFVMFQMRLIYHLFILRNKKRKAFLYHLLSLYVLYILLWKQKSR